MRKNTKKIMIATTTVLVMSLVSMSISSCNKKEETPQHSSNYLIHKQSDSKTNSNEYLICAELGHDGKNCPGCVLFNGKLIHRDCMGHGNYCHALANVCLNTLGTDITATTIDTFDLTSEDFFLMPDRSLDYVDENNNRIFLNIPEQLVYRDTTTLQFTFTGLFFSTTAAYNND